MYDKLLGTLKAVVDEFGQVITVRNSLDSL